MIEIRETDAFADWMRRLRDERAKARIHVRILRMAEGSQGDVRPIGHGISEMRIDYSPGYRVYFVQRGAVLVVLLCAGDKSTQAKDIATAQLLAAALPAAKEKPDA
ncbi:type II toxin-antitoxin system RelE/ParE family toxin [Niveispirillum sp. KHB5.9]|uniref:type II toxin-antitoxin system RelE/ParE family toxin n=1 Tax=Niveispirillum sp. KHB5.9 TaxID=3400269 RepID=UPI003A89D604